MAASAPPPIFKDATGASGLVFRHLNSKTPRKYLPETMGGGVAILDYNQDGWMDVFRCLPPPHRTTTAADRVFNVRVRSRCAERSR